MGFGTRTCRPPSPLVSAPPAPLDPPPAVLVPAWPAAPAELLLPLVSPLHATTREAASSARVMTPMSASEPEFGDADNWPSACKFSSSEIAGPALCDHLQKARFTSHLCQAPRMLPAMALASCREHAAATIREGPALATLAARGRKWHRVIFPLNRGSCSLIDLHG
jgi:hypothetical protein